jgi:hypothetical protein
MNATDISKEDTVRLDGRRGNWVVEFVWSNGTVEISRTTGHPRRGGMHYVSQAVHPDRLTLVRRGNRGPRHLQRHVCRK